MKFSNQTAKVYNKENPANVNLVVVGHVDSGKSTLSG